VIALLVVAVMALGAGLVSAEFSTSSPLLNDLSTPRGLATAPNGDLIVTEQGAGRALQVDVTGGTTVLVDGIVGVSTGAGPQGTDGAGISAARFIGDTLYFTTGEFDADGEDGFQTLYRLDDAGEPEAVADLFAYEQANNTDGETDPLELLSNPFDLVAAPHGGVLVSDSGANTVLHVDESGVVAPYAIFNQRPNPLPIGPPLMDQVPTGLTTGPDGAIYVSTLTGFPFPTGEARVYRLEDLNADGDALDDGETTIFAEGLTTATDLAFDIDGSLLVTEFSTDFLAQTPGRLVRVRDGVLSVVADGLVSPTAVLVQGARILVTQEFIGLVSEIQVLPTETLTVQAGGGFVAWVFGDTTASAVFGDLTIAWLWDGAWVGYVPQLGTTDFDIQFGDVLWLAAGVATDITVPTHAATSNRFDLPQTFQLATPAGAPAPSRAPTSAELARGVPADAVCFDVPLIDVSTDAVVGGGTDCLFNITAGDDGGVALSAQTTFNLPEGSFTVAGQTTVQAITTGVPNGAGGELTHITGSIPVPGENSVIHGTGAYANLRASVRLSGSANLGGAEGAEPFPATMGFDCVFIVTPL
jgi:hypothetical protein